MTRRGARPAAVLAALVLAAAAWQGAPWTWKPLVRPTRIGTLAHPRLAEASGAAVSRRNPGVIWTLQDSGNPPELLAIDSTGALRAIYTVDGAANVDWEEVALGPCGSRTCLYIADTGDNLERRDEVTLYRVTEPSTTAADTAGPIPERRLGAVERLRFRYPDHPHDVEAMAVTPAGDVLLVTKGRSSGVLVFRLPTAAWSRTGEVTATRIDSLPIAAAANIGRLVTGMALSDDGTRAVVRTYRDLFPFTVRADGTFLQDAKPVACDVLGMEPQGEGIAWWSRGRLLLTSEKGLFKAGTVWVGEC